MILLGNKVKITGIEAEDQSCSTGIKLAGGGEVVVMDLMLL